MKSTIIKNSCLALVLWAFAVTVRAQGGQRVAAGGQIPTEAKVLLEKVQKAYKEPDHLAFKVSYVYANAAQPNQPTDSLTGEIRMDKDRCRISIDNTETLVTGKYAIRIMNEEKLIYLSSAKRSSLPDLTGMTDSLLAHSEGLAVTVGQEGVYKVLSFLFPPKQQYSRIDMVIDPASGYLHQTTYMLQTEGLVGKEMIQSPGHSAPYQSEGIINVYYSNYEHRRFGDELFDENQIIAHVAGRYEAVGQYKNYQIFLASTNL